MSVHEPPQAFGSLHHLLTTFQCPLQVRAELDEAVAAAERSDGALRMLRAEHEAALTELDELKATDLDALMAQIEQARAETTAVSHERDAERAAAAERATAAEAAHAASLHEAQQAAKDALDAAEGSEIWSFATGGSVYSSPAVVGGVVYVALDGVVYALNEVMVAERADRASSSDGDGTVLLSLVLLACAM